MDVGRLHKVLKKTGIYLVFFYFILCVACAERGAVRDVAIDYVGNKAVSVSFYGDVELEDLQVFLEEESQIPVMGDFTSREGRHIFTPIVPFTAGQSYSVRNNHSKAMATFRVERKGNNVSPKILAIYPTLDSVPENLLKMYVRFSRPMQEIGNALDFISVYNDTDGMETAPFLNLETELWNKEHTLLTVWFDPGRIKTDLIPNKELGLPLEAGKEYTISTSADWKSADGLALTKAFSKKLYVGAPDRQKPKPEDWSVEIVERGPDKILSIDFGEPMDAYLAREAVQVYDLNGTEIAGTLTLENKERKLKFIPTKKWVPGDYELRIQSRLEDLAGNNLNRLFDTDLTKRGEQGTSRPDRRIGFKVR